MRNHFPKTLVSILLVLGVLLNMAPFTWAAELTNRDSNAYEEESADAGIAPYSITDDIPSAGDIKHEHNSQGWTCTFKCGKEEHQHSIEEGCYKLTCQETEAEGHKHDEGCYYLDGSPTCGIEETDGHQHTEDCYDTEDPSTLICEKTDEEHEHSIEEGCYAPICGQEEQEAHHHTKECYRVCGQEEVEGHKHTEDCYDRTQIICDKEEHIHSEEKCGLECTTDYVLLTVEYYVVVDKGEQVRIAETFQSLLNQNDSYNAPIENLKAEGYEVEEVQLRTKDDPSNPQTITFNEDDGTYTVPGTITTDTKISVKYKYTDELAPYQVDYWGGDIYGQGQGLIYSYIGKGSKDVWINASTTETNTSTIPLQVSDLMQNLSDVLSDSALGETGAEFIENLIKAVDAKYNTDQANNGILHDITPLLESIGNINSLTRQQIKAYVDEKLQTPYGLDYTRHKADEVGLTVTADELAKLQLYYVPKMPQQVIFSAGAENAEVKGIPQDTTTGIEVSDSAITAQPGVDISHYTENVYAASQAFTFVGWANSEDVSGVIKDFTTDTLQGKYKDLTIYLSDGADGSTPPAILDSIAADKKVKLSEVLKTMPDSGATYYAVWQPASSTYTVQLWFESEKGDNIYVESHALDIKDRMLPTAGSITFNDFDVERAQEKSIIDAANNANGALFDAITFKDPDGATTDTYHSYADYQNSPFFGFDFLECPVCKANPENCGAEGCTCGYQRKTNGDGTEGDATDVRACNYQKVEVNTSGDTVLNLYYNRETWEIAMSPSVQLWTVEALERPTQLNPYTYWIGGRRQKEIEAELTTANANQENNYLVIKGKYGVAVDEAHKNDIGWDKIGTAWQDKITEANNQYTIEKGTNILLANGSEAFQQADTTFFPWGYKRESGCYIYPQDTRTYTAYKGTNNETAEPQEWTLPFNCLSTIEEKMFTGHTAELDVEASTVTDIRYTRILSGVSKWEGNRFDQESSYDLTTGKYTYGTHRLNLYPYYHAISDEGSTAAKHTFNINYYVQALPHEEATARYTFKATQSDGDKALGITLDNADTIKFSKGETITVETPASELVYQAQTPEGMIPLMWRTSPKGFSSMGSFQGNGVIDAAYKYSRPQVYSFYQTPMSVSLICKLSGRSDPGRLGDHNGSFNTDNRYTLNGNSVYLSDWRQRYTKTALTQDGASVARMDPGRYWITDWMRAGNPVITGQWSNKASADKLIWDTGVRLKNGALTGATGLYNLIDQANAGDAEAMTLLDQMETSFAIGNLFPTGTKEYIYYHPQNPNAYRYSRAGQFNSPRSLANTENAVAFARSPYTITYNTCYLDDDGKLVRNENGDIKTTEVHKTAFAENNSDIGDMALYDQPLGYNPNQSSTIANFDNYYNNYYDAYFAADASADNGFSWSGYGNKGADKTGLGGYGKWYLDPDGTIPFTEENMRNMPAGNIDVYYHYNATQCTIDFVDDVRGKDIPADADGLAHVVHHQELTPGSTAQNFGDWEDPTWEPTDPDHKLVFIGWYYDKEGKVPYKFTDEIRQDTVVYAVWREKTPTHYKIRHILVDDNGNEIRALEETEWLPKTGEGEKYVGDTISDKAKPTAFYDDNPGIYFVPDTNNNDYSKTMILKPDKEDNVLTFRYRIPSKNYTVYYKDIDSKIDILDPKEVKTDLSQVTVGKINIPGWEYLGNTVNDENPDKTKLDPTKISVTITVTKDGVKVIFWYEREPIENTIEAKKLLDDVLPQGTWFEFELVDDKGAVVKTAPSIDGIINFKLDDLHLNKEGTYTYTLREKQGDGHFTYDKTQFKVEVIVKQPDKAKPLEYEVKYYKNNSEINPANLIFRNYRLPTEVKLEADKYVNDQPGDGFTFELEGGAGVLTCDKHIHNAGCYNRKLTCNQEEGPDHTHTDECYVLICGKADDPEHEHSDECYEKELVCKEDADPAHTAHGYDCYTVDNAQVDEQTASGGKVAFETLSFKEEKTYVYKVYELNEGEPNVEYDDAEYLVVIDVFINEDNEWEAKVTILLDGEEVEGMEFRNQRKTPTPDKPTDPDPRDPDPTNPDDPDDPDNPFDSGNPSNPKKPKKTKNPKDSDKPNNPDNPDDSENPTSPIKKIPSTGDEANLELWLALMGISAVGIAATLTVSKPKSRKKQNKK